MDIDVILGLAMELSDSWFTAWQIYVTTAMAVLVVRFAVPNGSSGHFRLILATMFGAIGAAHTTTFHANYVARTKVQQIAANHVHDKATLELLCELGPQFSYAWFLAMYVLVLGAVVMLILLPFNRMLTRNPLG